MSTATTGPDAFRRGNWMQTYTGNQFWPLDPRPEDISGLDIAHALSMICRFGGHTRRFYSVAEHSVLLSQMVAPEHAFWALMHDAAEAYVGDMVRPLKQDMIAYRETEDLILQAIAERFGLSWPIPDAVKVADTRILIDERDQLLTPSGHRWDVDGWSPLGVKVYGLSPHDARAAFVNRLDIFLDAAGLPPARHHRIAVKCRQPLCTQPHDPDVAATVALDPCPECAGGKCRNCTKTIPFGNGPEVLPCPCLAAGHPEGAGQ